MPLTSCCRILILSIAFVGLGALGALVFFVFSNTHEGSLVSRDYQAYCFDRARGNFVIVDDLGTIMSKGRLQDLGGLQGKIINNAQNGGILVDAVRLDENRNQIQIAVWLKTDTGYAYHNGPRFQIVTLGLPSMSVINISDPIRELPPEFTPKYDSSDTDIPTDLEVFREDWSRKNPGTLDFPRIDPAGTKFILYETVAPPGTRSSANSTGHFVFYDGTKVGQARIKEFQIDQAVGVVPDAIGVTPDGRKSYFGLLEGKGENILLIDLVNLKATQLPVSDDFSSFQLECVFPTTS